MRLPNLNALRMFDAAARHLNFRRAAEELHLTQGAVAQQVRRLEADLGTSLFERRARGLALTPEGRRFHEPVRRALALIADATAALRPEPARVTLSVPPSFAAKWLVPRLAGFAADHPEIDLQTVASEALADFRTDGVDLAIRQGTARETPGLVSERLAPLDLCAVCDPARAATVAAKDLADLTGEPLIQDGHGLWERLLAAASLAAARRIVRFNQTALAIDAAANGQGIALAPRLLVERDLTAGRLAVVWRAPEEPGSGFHLVRAEGGRHAPARDAVAAWLRVQAGP